MNAQTISVVPNQLAQHGIPGAHDRDARRTSRVSAPGCALSVGRSVLCSLAVDNRVRTIQQAGSEHSTDNKAWVGPEAGRGRTSLTHALYAPLTITSLAAIVLPKKKNI